MIIISHRGDWIEPEEKNSVVSFNRAFSNKFGVETDIRDYNGELVISHEIADDKCMLLADFFGLYRKYGADFPLALNIKADCLQRKLEILIKEHKISDYFVFDMAVPDGLQYLKQGLMSFTRQSEYETAPSFYKDAAGVWLDEFHSHWVNQSVIAGHLENNKRICIVSPELHQRAYSSEWEEYRNIEKQLDCKVLMLCTDHPHEAKRFFNEV